MKLSVEHLANQLETALGPDAVTADASGALASRFIDGKHPKLVCHPQSADHIAAALRLCTEAEAAVIPWGGATAMAIGNPPRLADVVIELGKLNRVIEHDQANLTASVQSGITWSVLQASLAPEKQFAPLDAPFPERATVGGIVAANLNGPRRSYYGSARDLVIGMKVVLASGEQIKAGGKVVKNVAGYDMCKLFVGSLGTLGIITEVTLRMAPIPENAATLIASGMLTRAERFREELFRSPLLPAAVLLLNDGETEEWRLAVWCEGFEESVARHLRDLDAIAARVGMNTATLKGESHDGFWTKSRDFPLQSESLIYRVTLPRAKIFNFTRRVQSWAGLKLSSDLAAGTVWLALPAHRSSLQKFVELIELARQQHGHAVVFAAPGELKQGVEVWGPAPTTISLQREIKRQFDPKGLLNPGRFLAGI
jgi:glycolate oxidase FAD binding subunit